jgi:hypothetical protein
MRHTLGLKGRKMTHSRIAFQLAVAVYLLAAVLPAAAQDAQGYSYNGAASASGAAVGKYKYRTAKYPTAAYAQVPESFCHAETWETADHYIRHVTMCGPW